MDKKPETFCIEIDPNNKEQMEAAQEAINQVNDDTNKYIENLAKELGLTHSQASDVWYLRTRSRHTDDLEARLIKAFKAGHDVAVMGDEDEDLKALGF